MRTVKKGSFVLLVASVFFVLKHSAHAYIDPNTGGVVFQILFPILSGLYFGILLFGRALKRMVRRIQSFLFHGKSPLRKKKP